MSTTIETLEASEPAQPGLASIPRTAWLALASGFFGWMFDSMDINIFTMVLFPSMRELLGPAATPALIAQSGGLIVALKLAGWGLGGMMFGVVADRIGRSKTLVITILIYCAFTGLSGLAQSWWQLAILQTIAGIGIGGEWATAGALITETWPERYRARAMQVMQMAWAFGFFAAALVNLFLGSISWRWVLAAGAAPAIICIFIRWMVPEPDRWQKVRQEARLGVSKGEADNAWLTFSGIFKPIALRGTLVGVIISMAMMVGSFPGLALIPTWVNQLMSPGVGNPVSEVSYVFMLLNAGALFGYLTMMWLVDAVGRRWAYTIFASCGILITWYVFRTTTTLSDLKLLIPIYGFFTVGGFGAPAAYLPELFPTRMRATGVGFCYNMSRLLTAPWPFLGGLLVGALGSVPMAVSAVELFLIVGIVAIWFGPETKGVGLRD